MKGTQTLFTCPAGNIGPCNVFLLQCCLQPVTKPVIHLQLVTCSCHTHTTCHGGSAFMPGPVLPSPAVPSPTVPSPTVPSPTAPSTAVPSPTVPYPEHACRWHNSSDRQSVSQSSPAPNHILFHRYASCHGTAASTPAQSQLRQPIESIVLIKFSCLACMVRSTQASETGSIPHTETQSQGWRRKVYIEKQHLSCTYCRYLYDVFMT